MNLQETLPLLRCPRSHTALSPVGDKLVSASGDEYPVVNGKPVLVRRILDWHVTPPREDKISQNIALFKAPKRITAADAIILHLGSGNVPSEDPRVISLDVLPCANVDLVAEAEELPFQDNSLDHVESGAVFEHLHDPWKAIAEIKRVLKPGGTFRIDTAFMQGYHGFPGHYYNMTPQAVETHLVGDFNLARFFRPEQRDAPYDHRNDHIALSWLRLQAAPGTTRVDVPARIPHRDAGRPYAQEPAPGRF